MLQCGARRREATGRGVMINCDEALRKFEMSRESTRVIIQGFGNVGSNAAKLMSDGGYKIIGIAELKEDSTAFLSAWVKRHIWRLPVEVPYVPKRRKPGFAIYAILSGTYSYMVLYIVARFAGNVSRNFSPEWAFIPEYGVALLVFKGRIRLLVNFMKLVYLDKKDRLRAWFTSHRAILTTAVIIVLLLLPVWRQSTSGSFILEPAHPAVVRAAVPGVVEAVYVDEAQQVSAGQALASMSAALSEEMTSS
jgi:hypothetical protein